MGAYSIYLESFLEWRKKNYASVPLLDLPRYFSLWCAGFTAGGGPMTFERPWLTFAAIDFLEKNVGSGDVVFEWGMGGSSLFFARRARHVVSLEHDAEWFGVTRQEMGRRGISNWEGFLVEPDPVPAPAGLAPADAGAYLSSDRRFAGKTFRTYASFIDRYPDRHFDVVLVDGRVRPSCIGHAAAKAGRLLMVDNAEREHYRPAYEILRRAGWTRRSLAGPVPHNVIFSSTDVWSRRA